MFFRFIKEADGMYYLDPSCRAEHPDQLFLAYDQVDKQGNITSKIFVDAVEKDDERQELRQVLVLPNEVQDGKEQPEPVLQTLKAVPISSDFPPMFILQEHIDSFKAANAGVTSFKITANVVNSEATEVPLESK